MEHRQRGEHPACAGLQPDVARFGCNCIFIGGPRSGAGWWRGRPRYLGRRSHDPFSPLPARSRWRGHPGQFALDALGGVQDATHGLLETLNDAVREHRHLDDLLDLNLLRLSWALAQLLLEPANPLPELAWILSLGALDRVGHLGLDCSHVDIGKALRLALAGPTL